MKKLLFLFLVFFLNCGFKNSLNDYKESFGYINSFYQLKPIFSVLQNNNSLGYEIDLINELLKEYKLIKATSYIVKHKENQTILITSNHVCDDLFSNENNFVDLLSNIKQNLISSNLMSESSFNLYSFSIEYSVTDFFGNDHKIISKNKKDILSDLCEIKTNDIWGKNILVEETECDWGDEVFNISVSAGYYFANAVPIRKGFYLGEVLNPINSINTVSVYTLQIQQGASGSIVFNSNGKVCGNINFTSKSSDISFGATNKQLFKFINSID